MLALVALFAPASAQQWPAWQAYRLPADKTPVQDALCLDGSPPLYYHSPGFGDGVDKWQIHMEGGAWCGSAEDCYGWWGWRSTLVDPDSLPWDQMAPSGYFNRTEPTNAMASWNWVFIRYCDGYSFSSNRAQPSYINVKNASGSFNVTVHSRGLAVLQAVQEDLLSVRGMGSASEVVVGGCSAGGMAVYIHCDAWAAAIATHNPSTTTRCLADSGFFPLVPDGQGFPSTWFNGVWRGAYDFHNSSDAMHPDCLAANSGSEWQCAMAEVASLYTKTPLFAVQSRYDSFQIFNQERCIPMPPDPQSPCNSSVVTQWGHMVTAKIKAWLRSPLAVAAGSTAFVDSCCALQLFVRCLLFFSLSSFAHPKASHQPSLASPPPPLS